MHANTLDDHGVHAHKSLLPFLVDSTLLTIGPSVSLPWWLQVLACVFVKMMAGLEQIVTHFPAVF